MATPVIVHTECKARGDFSYTGDLDKVLDIFFVGEDPDTFNDGDAEEQITREDALASFKIDNEVTFYNSEGERTKIVRDWNAQA